MSTALISDFGTGARLGVPRTAPRPRAVSAVNAPVDSPSRSHLRLTRRGRIVLTTLVALPLALGAAAFVLTDASAVATQAASTAAFEYVQVESGQSLWQIAAAIAPEADPRDVVSDIVHLNQLPSTDVQPGQRLAVPFQYAD